MKVSCFNPKPNYLNEPCGICPPCRISSLEHELAEVTIEWRKALLLCTEANEARLDAIHECDAARIEIEKLRNSK